MPSHDFNLKRDELILQAFRKIGVKRPGSVMTAAELDQGIKILNSIIREEDLKGTLQNKNLWALAERSIALKAGGFIYSRDDGLAEDILDLVSVKYTDTSGDHMPMEVITAEQYELIQDKGDFGDPLKAYLKRDVDLECQLLFIWPGKSSVSTPDEVTGSDGESYMCTKPHESAAVNLPVSGTTYRLFWDLTTLGTASAPATWVTDTDYTNSEQLRYVYKRPLYDFDNASDNANTQSGWVRYLVYRTAYDLAPEYAITMDERTWLKAEYMDAYQVIFPSTRPKATFPYNKAIYY